MNRFRPAIALVAIALACQSSGPAAPDGGGDAPIVRIELSTESVSLGADVDATSVVLTNSGTATVQWRIAGVSNGWITVSPGSGSVSPGGQATLTITVDRAGLTTGTHVGTIEIEAGDASYDVTVSIEQPGTPMAGLDPGSIDLGTSDDAVEARVTNAGDGDLHWTLTAPAWASVEPATGTLAPGAEATVAVTPDRNGLAPGTYTGSLALDSDGGSATAAVTLRVLQPARLRLSATALDFGPDDSALTVVVHNDGEGPLVWTSDPGDDWITADPGSGTVGPASAQSLTVRVSRTGLAPGGHQASLAILSNGGDGTIGVSLQVAQPEGGGSGSDGGGTGGTGGTGGGGGDPGTTALAGRIVGQFSGSGVGGLTVRFDNQTVVTDADGGFSIQGAPSSSPRALTLSSGATYTRETFARTVTDGAWKVIPKSFDMAAFDDVARDYEPRTIRWTGDPKVYFDVTPPTGYPPGSELDAWIQEVQGVVESFIASWTSGSIRAASLQVGTNPPPTGSSGWIVVGFSEDPTIYNDPRTVGLARTFWSVDRSIYSARIWFRFGKISDPSLSSTRVAVVGHELGHALGVGHMDGNTPSIMTPTISVSALTTFDRMAGDVLYSRSPGNTSPDRDDPNTWRGGLVTAAAGVSEWICDAPDERIR